MSSYFQEDINYLKILQTITLLKKPKKIVEFGILNGDSLLHMSGVLKNNFDKSI